MENVSTDKYLCEAMSAKKYGTVLFHILAWAILMSVPLLLLKPARPEHGFHEREFLELPEIISYLSLICVFYLNAFLLVPMFLSRKKIAIYILLVIILIALVSYGNTIIMHSFYPFHRNFIRSFDMKLFSGIFIIAISLSYRIIIDNAKLERIRKEKENETLKTELSFLRSQVSPHFMFNVLNNMVSLARKKSDKLEPILIELSNLMRYMLYESGTEKVSVEKEVEYLKSYINLQLLRFGNDVKVNFNIQKTAEDNSIEPMLFIPLVENAFKHGIGLIQQPEIDIQLVSNSDSIFIRVLNKFNNQSNEVKDKNSGIGLSNLERRLNLLYPGKHELIISEKENQFIVSLNLYLK
jgi:two-component system LytT family sensor kinase